MNDRSTVARNDNRRVEYLTQEKRRNDAEARRNDDQRRDDAQLAPVGPEEAADAAHVRLAHRLVGGALDRLARRESSPSSVCWHYSRVPGMPPQLPGFRRSALAA